MWDEARAAADELRRELAAAGLADECVGLRVVRNVAGRPVVNLGTAESHAVRDLAELLRVGTTRTLYVVRNDVPSAPVAPAPPFHVS